MNTAASWAITTTRVDTRIAAAPDSACLAGRCRGLRVPVRRGHWIEGTPLGRVLGAADPDEYLPQFDAIGVVLWCFGAQPGLKNFETRPDDT